MRPIADGSFFERPALLDACRRAAGPDGRLHLISLIGPGGVHANDRHLVALVELAARQGVPAVRVHALLDGRDTPPRSALGFVADLEARLRGGPSRRPHRVGRRALLRDGPRQPLGPRRAGLRRDRPRGGGACRQRHGRHRGGLRARRERRVRGPDRDRWRRRDRSAGRPVIHVNFRADRARQLTHALAGHGVRRVRPGRARRPAGADRPARRDADRVRGRPAGRGRLPAGGGALARPGVLGGGLAPVPRRRDREVRARHVLLQRWRRGPRIRARTGCWSRARRSRPTISSRR